MTALCLYFPWLLCEAKAATQNSESYGVESRKGSGGQVTPWKGVSVETAVVGRWRACHG